MKNSLKLVAAAVLSLAAVQAQATESLKRYNININETTISGLSAGGFMAHQFHLAHSEGVELNVRQIMLPFEPILRTAW